MHSADTCHEYDPAHMIVFSVDMPVAAQVTRASPSEPFLGLRLDLDPQRVANLVLRVYQQGLPPVHDSRAVYVARSDMRILEASIRLVELMARREDAVLLKVEDLARLANMSVSSFHQHFKSVTSMSPLQYQRVLRLQEARRLTLSPVMDAGTACRNVGCVSASQFSREYGRFFGSAPTRDIARLREQVGATADE